jgi:hypothetical protein
VPLLGYRESVHVENPPLGESRTSESGGTEGRPTETVAVMLGGEGTKCSNECSDYCMSMLVAL